MIAGLSGKLIQVFNNEVIIDCHGVRYEVLVPVSVAQRLDKNKDADDNITLITYHYLQVTPSSATPVLVGFLNEIERDFFLEFIKVSGIGPRGAVKALNKSISEIAQAIAGADTTYLTKLPGIGAQRAKEIVAKLQHTMAKFTLIQDNLCQPRGLTKVQAKVEEEALGVLLQLQYKRAEAQQMIAKALERNKAISTCEELLNEIYRQRIV